MQGDIQFCADNVIDIDTGRAAFAKNCNLAERIARENERNSLLSPGSAVIKILKPRSSTHPTSLPIFIAFRMQFAASILDCDAGTSNADALGSNRHDETISLTDG